MTSHYVITAHATSAGALVMRFTSRSKQLPFAYANDGASPMCNSHVTDERN